MGASQIVAGWWRHQPGRLPWAVSSRPQEAKQTDNLGCTQPNCIVLH